MSEQASEKKKVVVNKPVYQKIQEINIDKAISVFNHYDKHNKGYISCYDLKPALEQFGHNFYYSQCYYKMLSEFKNQNGQISFFDFTKIIVNRENEDDDHEDLLDAFVAMGGDENGDGSVDANKLKTIKDDFGLTIDIDSLIQQLDCDNSGQIELGEFNHLLQSNRENPEIEQFRDWFKF